MQAGVVSHTGRRPLFRTRKEPVMKTSEQQKSENAQRRIKTLKTLITAARGDQRLARNPKEKEVAEERLNRYLEEYRALSGQR